MALADVRRLRRWAGSTRPTVASWQHAWDRFTPFLAFGPALRKVIYTTNAIESLNYQLRKIIKNRGHFPNDAAAIKLLWLAIMNIEDKRARERAKEAGRPKGPHARPPAGSSKAPSSKAGKPPSPNSPSSTPTASTPTCNPSDPLTYTENLTGSVNTTVTSMLAFPVTRSISALPRACSNRSHTPSVTYRRASASTAAQPIAACSEGNEPGHRSTPGASAHRRNPTSSRAFFARCRSRSGLIFANARRHRRCSCEAHSRREPLLDRPHHRPGDRRRSLLRCPLTDHRRGVAVEATITHRLVNPSQPRRRGGGTLSVRCVVGVRRLPASAGSFPDVLAVLGAPSLPVRTHRAAGEANRAAKDHPPLRLQVREHIAPATTSGAS